jgi:hypothetical protein
VVSCCGFGHDDFGQRCRFEGYYGCEYVGSCAADSLGEYVGSCAANSLGEYVSSCAADSLDEYIGPGATHTLELVSGNSQ